MVDSGSKNKIVMTTIRDQSYWLELERQKQMSNMKTVAFASAAHEFRNPLNGIVASLDLLEDKIDLATGGVFFTTAKNCSNLMLYLIRDILDFSQIESKSFILNLSEDVLKEVLENCIDLFQFKAREKNIKLFVEKFSQGSDQPPKKIKTDINRVKQIIINLISNAIKYTSKGHVKIVAKGD